jgi:hypothetical protein
MECGGLPLLWGIRRSTSAATFTGLAKAAASCRTPKWLEPAGQSTKQPDGVSQQILAER